VCRAGRALRGVAHDGAGKAPGVALSDGCLLDRLLRASRFGALASGWEQWARCAVLGAALLIAPERSGLLAECEFQDRRLQPLGHSSLRMILAGYAILPRPDGRHRKQS
jgi:hypothetical protein